MSTAQSLGSSSIGNLSRIAAVETPRLQVFRSLRELERLRPAWDALLAEYPLASTFSSWEWLSCWWKAFGKDRSLLVIALIDSSSRLLGLAPLSLSRERFAGVTIRMLRLMGDGSWDSDNLDIPVLPGWDVAFSRVVLHYLREQKSSWDICELNTVSPLSPVVARIVNFAESAGWILSESPSLSSAIALPENWDDYLASLASEDQMNLVRYTRRLQNHYRTRIYRFCEPKELPDCLEALFRLHQGRWKSVGQPGTFDSAERRSFYQELSGCLLGKGVLELWVMELDAKIAAVQFAFRHKDRVFQLQEGYDHERRTDRLGLVLRGMVLRQLISEGVQTYDFLGGEESYKARWGAQPSYYRMIRLAPAFTPAGALLLAANAGTAAKQRLRGILPSSAWAVLQRVNRVVQRPSHLDRQTTFAGKKNSPSGIAGPFGE